MKRQFNKDNCIYLDASQPVERRVEDLLSKMTLEEKINQMGATYLDKCADENWKFSERNMQEKVDRLATGALHNYIWINHADMTDAMECLNAAQRYLIENTRLGIPAIITGEGTHGHLSQNATIFPHGIAMGSAWDPDLVQQVAGVVAKEARAAGVTQILAPVLDIARDPRWGRMQEGYGEDPYLTSRLGVAFVKGLQGKGPAIDKEHVAATPKHFAAHGSPEGGLNAGPVNIGPRELRSVHLPPFKAAICEGGALSIMPAYHDIDGIPCASSKELLTNILRGEWGFQGYAYSDWGSVTWPYRNHRTAVSFAQSGKQTLEAGMDMEMPAEDAGFGLNLLETVRKGLISEAYIDRAVRRILKVKFLLGVFEHPYANLDYAFKIRDCAEHRQLAQKVALESIILLKNENDLLPLSKSIKSIAVVGPNADTPQMGNYTGSNDNMVSVLQGIKSLVPSDVEVRHAEGCELFGLSTDKIQEAVDIARQSDIAVVVVGESDKLCNEGIDRSELDLPGVQLDLVKAVHATGTPTVVVLINGRSLAIEWVADNVPAILEAWFPGEEGGNAIAKILFGDANPCGKLPVTIPRSVGHLPVYYNHKQSARGLYHRHGSPENPGWDYAFSPSTPLFEFGHGLSYTRFEYSDLTVTPKDINPSATIDVSVTVKNVGDRQGAEVVQLFIRDWISRVVTPVKSLRRFKKIRLEPGESEVVKFTLLPDDLAFINEEMEYEVEPGDFVVMVGGLREVFTVAPGIFETVNEKHVKITDYQANLRV